MVSPTPSYLSKLFVGFTLYPTPQASQKKK